LYRRGRHNMIINKYSPLLYVKTFWNILHKVIFAQRVIKFIPKLAKLLFCLEVSSHLLFTFLRFLLSRFCEILSRFWEFFYFYFLVKKSQKNHRSRLIWFLLILLHKNLKKQHFVVLLHSFGKEQHRVNTNIFEKDLIF